MKWKPVSVEWVEENMWESKYNPTSGKQKEENMSKDTLYEIDRGDVFGTVFGKKLAVNSKGQWVMELAGSGEVLAVDPKNVQKVVPYTVGIKYQAYAGATVYHYLSNADADLSVGDFLIMDGYSGGAFQIAQVVEINSKSEKATVELKFHKKV